MEISVELSNNLYQDVSAIARTQKRSVGDIIENALKKAVNEDSADFHLQTEIIKRSVEFCSDKEILEMANLQTVDDERLKHLFEKNRESVLTKKERAELTKAVEASQLNDLRKAFGILEAKKRGLILA